MQESRFRTGSKYSRKRNATLKYFVKAFERAAPSVKTQLLLTARNAFREWSSVGQEPEACIKLWSATEVVAEATRWEKSQTTFQSLARVASALPGHERSSVEDRILARASSMDAYSVVEGLTLAPNLSPRLLDQALKAARQVLQRKSFLGFEGAYLSTHLARAGRVKEALEIAALIPEAYEGIRLEANVGLAGHLPPPHYREYLLQAWSSIIEGVFVKRDFNDAAELRRLVPRALEQPTPLLNKLFTDAIRAFSKLPRREYFDYLSVLLPIANKLEGPQGVAQIWEACLDVTRWWP